MNEQRLSEIEARANAATLSPWHEVPEKGIVECEPTGNLILIDKGLTDANRRFIVHTRQDVPDLIAEVRRLQMSLAGRDKAIELLNAGMKSLCEDRDAMKHELRKKRETEHA